MQTPSQPPSRSFLGKIFRFFVQGLLIIAPIAITVWAIITAFNFLDDLLPNLVNRLFPTWIAEDEKGNLKKIPGLGFAVMVVLVIIIGWFSSHFLMAGFIRFFDQWMARTPVIKFLYTSTKDFFEAFAGDKKRFSKAVLANVFGENVWVVSFMTDEELSKFELGADHVSVYVPQAYNFAGQLYLLPREKVKSISQISSGEAMKYALTGGVVDLGSENDNTSKNPT